MFYEINCWPPVEQTSPDFIEVFVSGRVKRLVLNSFPELPESGHRQCRWSQVATWKVEFLRFTQDGATDRRLFEYNPQAISGDYRNPVLIDVARQ